MMNYWSLKTKKHTLCVPPFTLCSWKQMSKALCDAYAFIVHKFDFFMVQEQLHEFLSTLFHSSHWLVDIIYSKHDVCTFLNAIIVDQHANGCFFNLDLPKILDFVSFTSKGSELPRWTSNKSKFSFKDKNIWLLA